MVCNKRVQMKLSFLYFWVLLVFTKAHAVYDISGNQNDVKPRYSLPTQGLNTFEVERDFYQQPFGSNTEISSRNNQISSKNNFDGTLRRKHSFSYYLAFSQPIYYGFNHPASGQRFDLDHDYGILMEFEYRRYFGDFYIGISNMYQSYEHEGISFPYEISATLVPFMPEANYVEGSNGIFALMLSAGWCPYITSKFFLDTKVSLGFAYNVDELTLFPYTSPTTLKSEYTSILYTAQIGLGYQLYKSMSVSLFWKLISQNTSSEFDNFLFHSLGLRLGYDF